MSDDIYKTCCPLPWLHFSAHTDGSMRVCCNTDNGGFISTPRGEKVFLPDIDSLEEYYNDTSLKMIRKDMVSGKRPSICSKCYQIEGYGGISLRQIYLDQFEQIFPEMARNTSADGGIKVDVRYVDFSLGNKCNLKCRMCNPNASSLLEKEWLALNFEHDALWYRRALKNWEWTPRFRELTRELLATSEEMLFTGGEPFISEAHYKILELAVEEGRSQDILLRYHTNLVVLPKRLTELWKSFQRIDIHVSVEGVGPVNELIRYPSKWSVFDKNFRQLIQLKNSLPLSIEVHSTFQLYTIFGIIDLLEYLKEFKDDIPPFPYLIWLDQPDFLSVTVLPEDQRIEVVKKIEDYLDANYEFYKAGIHGEYCLEKIQMLRGYIQRLQNEPSGVLLRKFEIFTEKLDRSREQSTTQFIPELAAILGRED